MLLKGPSDHFIGIINYLVENGNDLLISSKCGQLLTTSSLLLSIMSDYLKESFTISSSSSSIHHRPPNILHLKDFDVLIIEKLLEFISTGSTICKGDVDMLQFTELVRILRLNSLNNKKVVHVSMFKNDDDVEIKPEEETGRELSRVELEQDHDDDDDYYSNHQSDYDDDNDYNYKSDDDDDITDDDIKQEYDDFDLEEVDDREKVSKIDKKLKMSDFNRDYHHKYKTIFKCNVCSEMVNTISAHMDSNHPEEPKMKRKEYAKELETKLLCIKCDLYFDDFTEFKKHCRRTIFICDLCGPNKAMFNLKSQFMTHFVENHDNIPPFACQLCEKRFKTNTTLYVHLHSKHPETVNTTDRKCHICNLNFGSLYLYNAHRRKVHPSTALSNGGNHNKRARKDPSSDSSELIMCEICGVSCKNKSAMNQHMKKHREKKVNCKICKKAFKTIREKNYHVKTEHKNQDLPLNFICEICGEKFSFEIKYKYHLKNHNKEPTSYRCKMCNKDYESKSGVEVHIISHHTDKTPFECSVCGLRNKHPAPIARHMKLEHSLEKFFNAKVINHCDEETKRIISDNIEILHDIAVVQKLAKIREDKKTPNMTCQSCGKTFGRLYHLRRHVANVHEGLGMK